jgi:hypothetical protein
MLSYKLFIGSNIGMFYLETDWDYQASMRGVWPSTSVRLTAKRPCNLITHTVKASLEGGRT